jgi:S-methylmethionine-dependent homocysteine/selenocysteine methylase
MAARSAESAIKIAKNVQSQADRRVLVAGSIAPLEDCYAPQNAPDEDILYMEHEYQVKLLQSLGVDLILAETQNNIAEAKIVAKIAEESAIPLILSFNTDGHGNLISKEPLRDAVDAVSVHSPVALMLNCRPTKDINHDITVLSKSFLGLTGAYANGDGIPHEVFGWKFLQPYPEQGYVKDAKLWVDAGATIIGGCCGTTPEFIRALRENFPAL